MKKEKNYFKNLICIIIIGILTLGIYMGVKINKDPFFLDEMRTSIRTDKYFVKIEQDGEIENNKEKILGYTNMKQQPITQKVSQLR